MSRLLRAQLASRLFANFVRAVFLVTVAATKNISEVSRWHDIVGYTIVALVFVATMGLAYLLGRKSSNAVVQAGVSPAKIQTPQPTRLPLQASVPIWPQPCAGFSS